MITEYIKAFDLLGKHLHNKEEIKPIIDKAYQHNTWFSPLECAIAVEAWANLLEKSAIEQWLGRYSIQINSPKRVGLILAGNIPMVGFHDICSVLLTGHIACIKLSSQDNVLIPYLLNKLISLEPSLASKIEYVERLNDVDAVIATGSNNTAKYFEYYFSKKPNIIRKNRNSIAIINGDESSDDFIKLGEDIFRYYGQGCRNVSKLFVPRDYNFSPMLDALQEFEYIGDQSKYFNNYNYYKSIYLVNREHHLDNGFLLLKENQSMQAPLSVLYFEYYDELKSLQKLLDTQSENIQCIVGNTLYPFKNQVVGFGKSQAPGWSDYADGVDTVEFLVNLNTSH
jgi:Acyl-CoA reductase (LuxC)